MKYKVEKIFFKRKTLKDDSDKIALIIGNEKEIVSIFDNKDLEKKLNDFAKQGWELIHIESRSDRESKIIGTKTMVVEEYNLKSLEGYKGVNKLPKEYKYNLYEAETKSYYLCFFKKS